MAMLSNFDLIRRVRLFSMLTPEQAQTWSFDHGAQVWTKP